jgi:hypothetical protein
LLRFTGKGASQKGMLLTRLSALHEAATNRRTLLRQDQHPDAERTERNAVRAIKLGYDEQDMLGFPAFASSNSGEDLIDTAIRSPRMPTPSVAKKKPRASASENARKSSESSLYPLAV